MKQKSRTRKVGVAITLPFSTWAFMIVSVATTFFMTAACVMYLLLDTSRTKDRNVPFPSWRQGQTTGKMLLRQQQQQSSSSSNSKLPGGILSQYEREYSPNHLHRIQHFVDTKLRRAQRYQTQSNMPYDVYNCPPEPPTGYPMDWPSLDLIENWNPGNTTEPNTIFQGLCVFEYESDIQTATNYRKAEVPFLITHVPDIMRAAERWNRNSSYLSKLVGNEKVKTEHSLNQHFMYWRSRSHLPLGWSPPPRRSDVDI